EAGNARSTGAHAFRERALRYEFDFKLAGKGKLFEQFVLSNVCCNYFADLPRFQEEAGAAAVNPGVVADDGEILASLVVERADEVFRNAAKPESAEHDRGSVMHIGDRFL